MCGSFIVKGSDGSIFAGRSMQFPERQHSEVVTYNRGEPFESKAPDGTAGLKWVSKYGFTGITPFGLDALDDGMNEPGLTASVLVLEPSEYPHVPAGENDRALAMTDVTNWMLGSFATIEEVKEGLANVDIYGEVIKQMGGVPGLHIALHDTNGNSGVVEFINGKVNFYDNPNGVLTNQPVLPEQLSNLEKYENLTPSNGLEGLPEGFGPKDRFVRLSLFSHLAKPKDAAEAFQETVNILNATYLPTGVETCQFLGETLTITTLWQTIQDLKNKEFYFRPSNDSAFRVIRFKDLTLDPGTKHPRLPVYVEKPTIIDVTPQINPQSWADWTFAKAPSPIVELSNLVYKKVIEEKVASEIKIAEDTVEQKAEETNAAQEVEKEIPLSANDQEVQIEEVETVMTFSANDLEVQIEEEVTLTINQEEQKEEVAQDVALSSV